MNHPDVITQALNWLTEQHRIGSLKLTDRDQARERAASLMIQATSAKSIIENLLGFIQGLDSEHRMLSCRVSDLHAASIPGPDPQRGQFAHWSVGDNLAPGKAQEFNRAIRALFKQTGHLRENGSLAPMWSNQFDAMFEAAAARYCPSIGATKLKAQACRESALDPNVTNPLSGAQGIAQFMPQTFAETAKRMGLSPPTFIVSPFNPEHAIQAMAFYMNELFAQWKSMPRTPLDRWRLTLASYDAGIGNIVAAQRFAGSLDYASIIAELPRVTSIEDAKETTDYVAAIEKIMSQLPVLSS